MRIRFACIALLVGCAGTGWWMTGCGGDDSGASSDAGTDARDAIDSSHRDAKGEADSGSGVPPRPNLRIVAANDAALQGAPGDAVFLQVVFTLPDEGTVAVPVEQVTWTAPEMVVAQNPNDVDGSVLPATGAKPTAFFVSNPYTEQNPTGVLFIVDPGTSKDAGIKVTASISDAGEVSAVVAVSTEKITGDATRGGDLFQNVLACASCHGMTAGGSIAMDGGEGGAVYTIGMHGQFPYPAPPLNDVTTDAGPNLAADPEWNAALLGMAAQADMDDAGVALRTPMPDFFEVTSSDGGATLNAQDFADIYAWLKTQQ